MQQTVTIDTNGCHKVAYTMTTTARHRHRLSHKELSKLAQCIALMGRDSALYRLLRDALTIRGNWKAAPRGRPSAGHLAPYQIRPKQQTYEPLSD